MVAKQAALDAAEARAAELERAYQQQTDDIERAVEAAREARESAEMESTFLAERAATAIALEKAESGWSTRAPR